MKACTQNCCIEIETDESVDYTQLVLDRKFLGKGKGVDDRTWNSHMPMMHDKRIIEKIWEDFPLEAELTR